MKIVVHDNGVLLQVARKLSDYAAKAPAQIAADLNTGGAAIRQTMTGVLAAQTGLPTRTMTRALVAEPATPGKLSYGIRASGGDVRLKFFHPVESGSGVTATPWGRATSYAGAFIKGGRVGARVDLPRLNGQVMQRVSGKRLPIEVVRSGVTIPTEMLRGATREAIDAGAAHVDVVVVRRLGSII